MAFNLKNRIFFTLLISPRQESIFCSSCLADLKAAKYAGYEVPSVAVARICADL